MSVNQREIVTQAPPPAGVQVQADDRFLTRWVINMGAPISLAEMSGSRFIGKFDDDVLPAKVPVSFQPGYARSTGLYEHPAMVGNQSDMMLTNHADSMLGVPVNSDAHGSAAALTAYNNHPKFCAYILMRDYERRGLCLFETLKGTSEEEFLFLLDLIIPPEKEKEWSKTKRVVLEHEFQGPFLDQYLEWLGTKGASPWKTWYNASVRTLVPSGLDRQQSDKHGAMVTALRNAVLSAWRWENSVLNSSEQQIRRFRNGKLGKEYYDQPDERFANPVPPLDLLCMADTNRQPIDLQQIEAANVASKATSESVVEGMRLVAQEIAKTMTPPPPVQAGVTMADVEELLAVQRQQFEGESAARAAEWQAKLDELKAGTVEA